MLSVLIPTYNYNTFSLVKELYQQLILENINFEILCFDDASNSELNLENQKINILPNSTFKSLPQNLGRSAIRNLLAKEAKNKWLLFLDADVCPKSKDFIKQYITKFKVTDTVFCGGLLYEDTQQNKQLLRYKFGKKHEAIPVKERQANAEKYFFTSNFLIEKAVFKSVKFEEKLIKYGREDLLFSLELVKKGFNIEHITNEVYHLGLDDNATFVAKTKKAMENLVFIEKEQLIASENITLLKFVNQLKKVKLNKTLGKFYTLFERLAINKSSVFYLSCMKVCYLCYLKSSYE
ncbi:glycosyltransferase [Polaribacter vadi]|uniref:glycosyltransferase family 2 protein n=1 Tax=Polaribacter TaxID=52959 RepID=UPI001C0A1396|nr:MULTISPECIES: glycosyltransferase [Polaribacter]MBU3009825.1 glycosyltransferase [Polaribacter vadi]MDO6739631.1 glycosyltransferase [Polaribacter sp. 1_MG-2023]